MKFTEQHFLRHLLGRERLPEPVLEVGVGWDVDFHRQPFSERGYTRFLTQDMQAYEGSEPPDFVCDVCDLAPIDDGSIGTLLCFNVLEHCHAPWDAVTAMRRVLAEGGVLVGSVPLRTQIHRHDKDYWRFCPDGIAELFRSLRMEQFVIEGNPRLPANLLFVARRDRSKSDWSSENAEIVAEPFVITETDYLTPNPIKKAVVRVVRALGYDLGLWTDTRDAEQMRTFGYREWTLVPHGTEWDAAAEERAASRESTCV
jgi:SAM-dependent methyltransferase